MRQFTRRTDGPDRRISNAGKPEGRQGNPISIVVVCEAPDERALLVAELELFGYWEQVRACANAGEARLLASAQRPDLLIVRFAGQSQAEADDLRGLVDCCNAMLIQGIESTQPLFSALHFLAIPCKIQDLIACISLLTHRDLAIDALLQDQVIESADTEGKYKDLFDRASDAIMLIDFHTHTIIDVNLRTTEMYGYSREEFVGMNLLQIIPTDHHLSVYKNTKKMAGEVQRYVIKVNDRVHIKKDGTPIQVSISASIIEYAGRRVFQDIVRDETARILMEETLKKANEHLRELDQLKSVFIASMSHELRTPLNSIIGFTGMIVDDMVGTITEMQRNYLQRVRRSAHHLLSLITDIIDVAKIDAGKLAADYADFDLAEVLSVAQEQIEPMAREKSLAFEMTLAPGITLHSERKRLLQCVINLLSNAVKYTERGTVTLTAELIAGQVNICVRDTGIGVTEVDLARLYEPFTRLESPLKITAGGSGLGLYLTRKIAREVLGGDVVAQSVVGVGSSFCLCVPMRVDEKTLKSAALELGRQSK